MPSPLDAGPGCELTHHAGGRTPHGACEVGAVAAALPDARLLALAGQQHIADILDPENFAKHLLEFLHRPTPRTGGLS